MLNIKLHHCRSLETDICLWKSGDKPGSTSSHSGHCGPCRIWCWFTLHLRLVSTQVGLNKKYPGAQAQKRASLLPQYRHSRQIWLIEVMHRTKLPVWWDLTKMLIGWNCLSLIPTYLTFQLTARLKQTAPIYCSRPLIMDTLLCTLPHYCSGQAVNRDSCHFWQIVASKMNGGSHMTT